MKRIFTYSVLYNDKIKELDKQGADALKMLEGLLG